MKKSELKTRLRHVTALYNRAQDEHAQLFDAAQRKLRDENAKLRDENAKLRDGNTKLQGMVLRCAAKLHQPDPPILKSRVEELERVNDALRADLNGATEEVGRLRSRADDLEHLCAAQQKDILNSRQEIKRLLVRCTDLDRACADYRKAAKGEQRKRQEAENLLLGANVITKE